MDINVRTTPLEQFKAYMRQAATRDWRPEARRIGDVVARTLRDDLTARILLPCLASPDGRRVEFDRRMVVALTLFMRMVGDLRWSVRRALDHLYEALRCTVDGNVWTPPEGGPDLWVPDNGAEQIRGA